MLEGIDAARQTLIMGEAPRETAEDDSAPLSGPTAEKLIRWMGFSDGEMRRFGPYVILTELFQVANLLHEPGAEMDSRATEEARVLAAEWTAAHLNGELGFRRVILLGRAVGTAFNRSLSVAEWWKWIDPGGGIVFGLVPHPSGRNLLYNNPEARIRTGLFLWEALR